MMRFTKAILSHHAKFILIRAIKSFRWRLSDHLVTHHESECTIAGRKEQWEMCHQSLGSTQ